MNKKLITDAAVEPISTTEAKLDARVDGASEDSLVSIYISAARKHFEAITDRALITQTHEVYYDKVPTNIVLPIAPVQSITSIKYLDTNGAEQTLATSEYTVDVNSSPARIKIDCKPSVEFTLNALTVRFVAGYGDAATDVPADIRRAVLYMCTQFYEHRTPVVQGTISPSVGLTFEALTRPHKLLSFD